MYVKLDDFRANQTTRRSFPVLIAFSGFLLIVAAIILATELVSYSDAYNNVTETFGSDVRIGGVQVGGLNEADRLARLESVYIEQPIVLRYKDSPILLMPSTVGFRLDTAAMQTAAATQVESNFWGGFWKHLWRRGERSIAIPLSANFEEAELRRYLEELAFRYDSQAGNINFDPATYTFRGTEGQTRLDLEAAMRLIEGALYEIDPARRVIDLPLITTPGQQPTMATLRQAILDYFQFRRDTFSYDGPDSAAAVFVMDLQTGEEMGIQENLPMGAASTIKIGVIINYFRYTLTEPTADDKFKLAEAVICSVNGAANLLIDRTGEQGFWADGMRKANDTMCRAGAVNTRITTHLWIGEPGTGIIPVDYYTPASTTPCPGAANVPVDTSVATAPDPYNYTTAADIGTLLMQIYDCAINGSGLRTIFPEAITQTECGYMLELMRGTHFIHLMELGIPEDLANPVQKGIAHKVGYSSTVFGDAGIVFSPGGDYVFVMYIWEPDRDGNNLTDIFKWPMIGDVSRIVYNYFNPDQPLQQTRQPPTLLTGAACVLPLSGYEIDLTNINAHRFDEHGIPIAGEACYDYDPGHPCQPFDNWGRN